MSAPDCLSDCLHCLLSEHIMAHRGGRVSFRNMCEVGQIVADMIASIDDEDARRQFGSDAKREIVKMLDEALAGEWHAFQTQEPQGSA